MRQSALLVQICALLALGSQLALAGQGCPFDDGSCQEYCGQQGCNMGYCGHFAWIQCICRKCGDEWSWYDKVHTNPDKAVNQTELDSLKLNGTAPLILTNSAQKAKASAAAQAELEGPKANGTGQRATLTTLLIPDLSEGGKLGLNDIPDENSDKFLDYLAKNHERLVQATSASTQTPELDEEPDESAAGADDDTVELQITSNSNGTAEELARPTGQPDQADAARGAAPVTRLLRMAVAQRNSDEID